MGITISIIASDSAKNSSVQASGSIEHVITNNEANIFGLDDHGLKSAVDDYFGRTPDDAYLHKPTPWGDLYTRYGWPQVKSTMNVISAEVLEMTSEPVALASRRFDNNHSTPATFNADLSDTVTESTESNWSETYGFEVGQTISYGVEFSGVNIGGETSMSYSQEFGRGGSQSKEVSISTTSGVSFELAPGEQAEVEMTGSRGVLKVQLTYEITLSGDTAVNYNPTHKGHHFWALPINAVLESAGKPTSFTMTEVIEVGYYSNGEISVNKINESADVAHA